MVPNGAAYNNFPPFGTNGTKTPPGGTTESAKYALGMVPADTFPAEWANYLFYGATQGITRLNADTGSIKKEINSVLSNFNITPEATLNNQLLEALNKLKSEAALAAHPVGSLYWTSVNENPAVTFGGGTWVQIKDKFILSAGDIYNNGATGGSATVTLSVNQIPSHTHTFTGTEHSHSYTPTGKIASTSGGSDNKTASESAHTHGYSHTHGYTPAGKIASTSGGTDNKTAGMSAHATIPFTTYGMGNGVRSPMVSFAKSHTSSVAYYDNNDRMYFYTTQSGSTWAITSSDTLLAKTNQSALAYTNDSHGYYTGNLELGHTHNAYFSGNAGTTTSQSATTTGAGSSHSHTAYFTGTSATLKATAGGTNDNTGGGQAHNNMPPYIVKFCWERTA